VQQAPIVRAPRAPIIAPTSGRYGFAAALLGLQSGPPILYGFVIMLAATFLTAEDFETSDGESFFGDVGSAVLWVGFLLLAFGISLFAASVGVAMSKGWGRLLALVCEGLTIALVVILWILSGEAAAIFGVLFILALPITVFALVIRDET
jgi:hypothetical protein